MEFLNQIGMDIKTIEIRADNRACVELVKNLRNDSRVKHMDIKAKFIHDMIKLDKITLKQISTHGMIADIFTKPLGKIKFENFRKQLPVLYIFTRYVI